MPGWTKQEKDSIWNDPVLAGPWNGGRIEDDLLGLFQFWLFKILWSFMGHSLLPIYFLPMVPTFSFYKGKQIVSFIWRWSHVLNESVI